MTPKAELRAPFPSFTLDVKPAGWALVNPPRRRHKCKWGPKMLQGARHGSISGLSYLAVSGPYIHTSALPLQG
ncbi:uncharacterized protein JN550_011625 [Neoarthrinium moseri]|uniref:uncharacterized protein n=1 Tax=Neoarthrinium moseri TaxID=1658444 RepID=UPI001FDE1DF7|nr:uncharacterized protein JN550_011625 [Neoarthrinium moseri]KAI1860247.1 hypothetical protein JN550_011625 [Neoarthrinium moseri]